MSHIADECDRLVAALSHQLGELCPEGVGVTSQVVEEQLQSIAHPRHRADEIREREGARLDL